MSKAVNVFTRTFILITLLFSALSASARSFSQCVSLNSSLPQFEQEEALVDCFETNKSNLSSGSCYAAIHKIKAAQKSATLNERLKTICFYDVSLFKNDKLCMARASEFSIAENHDEALFECFNQFQESMNQKSCLEMSSKLIYPAKKEHLRQHCLNN